MMYSFEIDWITVTFGEKESGKFPLHIMADSREDGLLQALKIAQGMSRAFNDTVATAFYYRIINS